MGQRYRRMEDQTPWLGLAHNQDFSKGRTLEPKPPEVLVVWGRSPQPLGDFL